ncbi:MAG: metallophosphoesterase [Flaviaesturariibacter sp.]|nr:metallophosphoesterase [Flaviaesturariibacter sp.]
MYLGWMKQLLSFILILSLSIVQAQTKPFRFAFISDTHIGSPNGGAEEDLRRTVADINSLSDISFIVLTGDITELGTNREIALAKTILDSLKVKYYIIPGNHDTGWSESGGLTFTSIFGSDKFFFKHYGINFIGCASGPYVRMSDGHVPRSNMNWMKEQLAKIKGDEPVVFLNHYPLDEGLDNWYEVIDMLKQKNTVLALCGHGHNNRPVKAEEIPAVMGRSNLRAKATEGGYNLVDVRTDSILFTERKPLSKTEKQWTKVAFQPQHYDRSKAFPRPDFSMNETYKAQVKPTWTYSSAANVISTPVVTANLVVYGNQAGLVEALSLATGKKRWTYQTRGPIFSSPAATGNKIVFGSTDSSVYCLSTSGKLLWKTATAASVLGCPVIQNGMVYIGGSDHHYRALDLQTGKEVWQFAGLEGPVTSTPVLTDSLIIFGAWDRYLYALDKRSGKLKWKWGNGSSVINYSPAACIPVVKDDVVYVVAPDRYLTAIDLASGNSLWRTNEATVRESLGVSEDGAWIYGKTMQDTLVAFRTGKVKTDVWKMNVGYGYEHAPSMLVQKAGTLYFGSRNGIVYAIDPATRQLAWKYKLDNSMVNTVNVLESGRVLASTMDGKVMLLQGH